MVVAQKNRPLYPKVAQNWHKVAHNYGPLALQVSFLIWDVDSTSISTSISPLKEPLKGNLDMGC